MAPVIITITQKSQKIILYKRYILPLITYGAETQTQIKRYMVNYRLLLHSWGGQLTELQDTE